VKEGNDERKMEVKEGCKGKKVKDGSERRL
jgi:hypothetical protein